MPKISRYLTHKDKDNRLFRNMSQKTTCICSYEGNLEKKTRSDQREKGERERDEALSSKHPRKEKPVTKFAHKHLLFIDKHLSSEEENMHKRERERRNRRETEP